jgi:hypothetical protein
MTADLIEGTNGKAHDTDSTTGAAAFAIPPEDFAELASDLGKRQWEIHREKGVDMAEARRLAMQEWAVLYNVTGEELNRSYCKAMNDRKYAAAREDGGGSTGPFGRKGKGGRSDSVDSVVDEIEPATGAKDLIEALQAAAPQPRNMRELYRDWCGQNDEVPNDATLAFFTGATGSAFAKARRALRDEGYTFERAGGGWKITSRPVHHAQEIAELHRMLDSFDAQMSAQRAEIMARLDALSK